MRKTIARFNLPSRMLIVFGCTMLISDVAGNSCELCLNFRNLPQGPTLEEVLCCADGLHFFVDNANPTPPGPSFCSTAPFTLQQPVLPAWLVDKLLI